MRDVAERGEIAGIAVCNQAAASHALPFGWDPWASLVVGSLARKVRRHSAERTTANSVKSMILKSSQSDQFSM